ncbi:MAG TPA: ABC transporter ATP-binding protein [Phycisphaerae bacterium]|nr:ABC transporter ATP-binding protein [Phycisphaerae bacterium]
MAIELREVTKRFGQKVAVDRVSLHVGAGEIFAFLGPNGAGKTTTIKLIAGLLRPDSGSVRVSGHDTSRDGGLAKAELAYVPDHPFLYDKLTGREFLGFVAEMYRVPPGVAKERTDELVKQFEMNDFLDQLTEGYSHGMKQRTLLAAALLHEPQVLLIDEPMVGLDPKTVRLVKNMFVELAQSGRSVFMSTHTLEVAEAVADRIGIIHHGRLIAAGALSELRRRGIEQASLEEIFLTLTADRDDPQAETVPA